MVTCERCGQEFERSSQFGREPRFCGRQCRRKGPKAPPAPVPVAARSVPAYHPQTVRKAIGSLVGSIRQEAGGATDTAFDARAALALSLAATIDDPGEGTALAPIARELRTLIAEMQSEVVRVDDGDAFGSDLPAQVRHPPQS